MEVEIISKEKVKPSSPTPHHLKIYKLSLLDQIMPPTFFPVILYFLPDQPDSDSPQKIHILKESLSVNLTRFYPFAGVINDDLSVDCNDEGIPFSLAKVRGNLQDFLSQPDLLMTMKFLPTEKSFHPAKPGDHVSEIQVNFFECGGLAVGTVVTHSVADGTTISTFLRGWAAAARSTGEEICPKFIGHDHFPSIDAMDSESKLLPPDFSKLFSLGKYVTRRYLFEASIIAKLKERARSDASVTAHPTSVEVVSTLIWKCYMKFFTEKSELEKPFLLMHSVNLRRRADPALPDESFGNFLWVTAAQCTSPTDTNFKDLASEVKRAIKKIDNRFVKVLQNNGYYENLAETRKWLLEGAKLLCFSSLCKFGLYDVDFGWGKPIWISFFVCGDSESIAANGATLMDTRFGDGIEAWVVLDEKYVAAFEENEDMQNYVLINPSPLQIGERM